MSVDERYEVHARVEGAAPAVGKTVSVSWAGAVMALGAVIAAVGAFLPMEKLVFIQDGVVRSAYQFTGLGSISHTGETLPFHFSVGNGGRIIMSSAVLALAMAVLVLRGKGRLWVRILGLLAAASTLFWSLITLAVPKSDAKTLNDDTTGIYVHGLVKTGSLVCSFGAVVVVVGALLALGMRRRHSS